MTDEPQKIIVEVPSTAGNFSPLPPPPQSRLDSFRQEWRNAIAFPNNLTDLIFDITSWVVIPALFTSCWVSLPLPLFVRSGVMVALVITGVITCYLRQAIPEAEPILLIRLVLVIVGVAIGT